ncbi:MAG: hypothetical protein HY820_06320 [Acidobacteria bacterium]|nr:hypothetical protein [Acidobacteriota bacterium]
MKRLTISAIFAGLLALGWMMATPKASQAMQGSAGVTGDKYKFRLLYNSSHLPTEAQNVLKGAHGGFAVDMRPGKGETYFYLKGAGIIQISADLKSTRMISTPPEMKSTNMHNAQIWTARDGQVFLTWPGNESNAVYTTTVDGKLVHTLKTPAPGTDVGHPNATNYFMGRGNFIPTDVEQLDGMFYVTTGYSSLDYVLTAKVTSTSPFKAEWNDLAFGGRGPGAGQLGTGHGVTIPPGTKRVDVSDRSNSEIDRYTRYGQYISTLKMPYGSLPCDIYYLGNLAVVGALDGPNRAKGAPIYILENDELVSTISVKDDLGLEKFTHVHNAVMRRVNGKLYVIAQAWNPGDFAILEQVN